MRIVPLNALQAAARCNASARRLPPLWLLSLGLAAASAQAQETAPPVAETPAAVQAIADAPAGTAPPATAEPTVPAVAPAPPALAIVPLSPERATERALGARCPVDLAGRLATQGDLLTGACQGTMPAHLAALLVALPEQDIQLARARGTAEGLVQGGAWVRPAPGLHRADGRRLGALAGRARCRQHVLPGVRAVHLQRPGRQPR
ncbi:conserved exported hypothetical protein [Stenotrophomonas maltophilia]|nr:conserved exported hypothetical protein [Stenotrophomonas maltophilia]